MIDRQGSHELLLEPTRRPVPARRCCLQSERAIALSRGGNQRALHRRTGVDLNLSYVYSQARADLNAFTIFFDNVLTPVVGENGYGAGAAPTCHIDSSRAAAPSAPQLAAGRGARLAERFAVLCRQ